MGKHFWNKFDGFAHPGFQFAYPGFNNMGGQRPSPLALSLCVPLHQLVDILAVTAVHECQEFEKCFNSY